MNKMVTDQSTLKLSATKVANFSHQITMDDLPTVATENVQRMPTSSSLNDMLALMTLSETSALINVLRS